MANGVFSFTLDSFRITDTRSLHEDTDYVTFTLLVKDAHGNGTPKTLTKAMGNKNNGTFPVNLTFSNISVGPTDTVVMNYLIVNSGHKNPSDVVKTLESTGEKLATAGGAAIGAAIGSTIPGLGTALGALAGWLAGQLTSMINANCDGAVAAEQDTFNLADLNAKTSTGGKFSHTTKHPGTDSPHGCGSNSMYYVNWHIQKVG